MAETTGIAWTDSTFNPWLGCTKVGPGCDHCYAEALDNRHRWGGATHWGAGVPRMRTSAANWRKPLAWNKKAAASGKPWRVFCASLADVFDNEVPEKWRAELWNLIALTPSLTWLLLTKRIGNAAKMLPINTDQVNVWIGATVVNQEEADRDIPKLLATPAAKRFISYEPAVGPISFRWLPVFDGMATRRVATNHLDGLRALDWIIVGGESGPQAREFDTAWAAEVIAQCREAGIAPFVKQLGARPKGLHKNGVNETTLLLKDRAGADLSEWPEALRVQEFPS